MTYCQSVIQIFRNYFCQTCPAELEIKTRLRETPLLPTWIYLLSIGRNGQLRTSLNANVTISTSISQTFLSCVAIFHLRQPMVCLSHKSYGMSRLAPLMNVLFWERCDFYVRFSGRDVRERLKSSLMKFYGRYGDLIKYYEVPLSQM